MKIVLDITKLVEDGALTPDQAEKLSKLATKQTGSLGINILLSLGVVAIAGGFLALEPSVAAAFVIGVILVVSGLALKHYRREQWGLLGTANLMVGALTVSGALIILWEASVGAFAVVALILLSLGILAESGLLIGISPLVLASVVGSSTGYLHASYMLVVREATITIVLFTLLAGGAFSLSKRLPAAYERLAIIYSRVCLVLVNLGFWVGSLWGDYIGESWVHGEIYENPARFRESYQVLEAWRDSAFFISDVMFSGLWALALMAVAAWAVKRNRRFVVNTAAVFGSILFYTQWFERLGASPVTVIISGVIAVGIALGLWKYNRLAA